MWVIIEANPFWGRFAQNCRKIIEENLIERPCGGHDVSCVRVRV